VEVLSAFNVAKRVEGDVDAEGLGTAWGAIFYLNQSLDRVYKKLEISWKEAISTRSYLSSTIGNTEYISLGAEATVKELSIYENLCFQVSSPIL
jgi:hypothetical protein